MTSTTSHPDGRRDRDVRLQTAIDEADVVRRYSGRVGWPTVLMCAGLVTVYMATSAGWARGAAAVLQRVGDEPLI